MSPNLIYMINNLSLSSLLCVNLFIFSLSNVKNMYKCLNLFKYLFIIKKMFEQLLKNTNIPVDSPLVFPLPLNNLINRYINRIYL